MQCYQVCVEQLEMKFIIAYIILDLLQVEWNYLLTVYSDNSQQVAPFYLTVATAALVHVSRSRLSHNV